jgi:PAS domain S-box-containing protein
MKRNSLMRLPSYLRYSISIIILLAVTFLKLHFFSLIGYQTPFLIYFGVVFVNSWFFGRGPAICSALIISLMVTYFFMPPYESFEINANQFLLIVIFLAESFIIIQLSSNLAKALKINQDNTDWFKAVIEKSSDAIIVVNAEGKRTYCSKSVENVIGYTAEEYLSFEPWKLGHPDELDQIRDKYKLLVQNPGGSLVLQHRMKHKKGHWIWVESRVTNSLNEPQINAMIANFNDVSERVEREQSRKDFIGIVSHELKTPLTSIKAYGEIISQNLEASNNKGLTLMATKLVQQTSHMAKMINDLVDVTIINAGRLHLDITDFDFNAFVYEIVENFRQTNSAYAFIIELAPLVLLSGDKERIGQVIINLLSNAIKYSPSGGEIYIVSQKKNSMLEVSICDQGIGIPKEELNRIFERLYRVSTVKHIKGLGLGLYICQQIIQNLGGSISVESEEGKGSVFRFSLPLTN